MMYGHVDTPAHWVGHLRLIRGIQERTGGFTEFVPLPFVHASAPIYLAGAGPAGPDPPGEPSRARDGAAAAARRDRQHPVLLGEAGRRRAAARCCSGGVNDLGGTLMEETISRMAGSANGSFKTISQLAELVAPTGRPMRQRTTTYGQVPAERQTAAAASDGVCAAVRTPLPLITG